MIGQESLGPGRSNYSSWRADGKSLRNILIGMCLDTFIAVCGWGKIGMNQDFFHAVKTLRIGVNSNSTPLVESSYLGYWNQGHPSVSTLESTCIHVVMYSKRIHRIYLIFISTTGWFCICCMIGKKGVRVLCRSMLTPHKLTAESILYAFYYSIT